MGSAGVDVDNFVEVHVYVSDCVFRCFFARARQRMGDVECEVEGFVFTAAAVAVVAVVVGAVSGAAFYGEHVIHPEVSERDVVGFFFAFVVVVVAAYAAVEEVFHLPGVCEQGVDCGLHVLDCDHNARTRTSARGLLRRGIRFRLEFLSRGIDAVEETAEFEVVIDPGLPFGCPSSGVEGQDFGAEVVCRYQCPPCPECGDAGDVGIDRAGVEVENGGVDGYGGELRESAEELFEVSVGGGVGV